ncbi:hypothetical protein M1D72_12555 [Vibrio sp. AK197]
MTQIIVGNSNSKGYGSAAKLTVRNGTELPVDQGSYYEEDVVATHLYNYTNLEIDNLAGWDSEDIKEVAIRDGDYVSLSVTDFVDVAILGGSYDYILLNQAKRATIDLSDAQEGISLFATPYSNNDHWSNLYNVTMGAGDDHVAFSMAASSDPSSSKWTEFNVDLALGNDIFEYDLNEAASSNQQRFVDGGDGFDSLILSSDNSDIDFVNFEYIELEEGETLTLTQTDLENNGALDNGLIVNGQVALSEDFDLTSMSIRELTDVQRAHIEQSGYDSSEIVAVNLYTGDNAFPYYDEHEGEYTLFMKESDIDYANFHFPYTIDYASGIWADYFYLKGFGLWDSYDFESTQWLEVSIDMGSSDDRAYYGLAHRANNDIERIIDAGAGIDVLRLEDDINGLEFQNFEKVYNMTSETLTLTEDTLANNSSSGWLSIIGKAEATPQFDHATIHLLDQYSPLEGLYAIDYGEYVGGYYYDDPNEDLDTFTDPVELSLTYQGTQYTVLTELSNFEFHTNTINYRLDASYDNYYYCRSFDYQFSEADDYVNYNVSIDVYDDMNWINSFHFVLDGGEGFDTVAFELSPEYLDFSDFEYIDVQFDGDLKLDQTLLANNASADDGLIVNGSVDLLEDIHGIFVDELSNAQQALFDNTNLDSDDFEAVTVFYNDDSYTLLMDVDDLAYHLAA